MNLTPEAARAWVPLSVRRKHADPKDPDFTRFMEGVNWLDDRWSPTLERLHREKATILALLANLPPQPTHGASKTPEAAALAAIRLILEETP